MCSIGVHAGLPARSLHLLQPQVQHTVHILGYSAAVGTTLQLLRYTLYLITHAYCPASCMYQGLGYQHS